MHKKYSSTLCRAVFLFCPESRLRCFFYHSINRVDKERSCLSLKELITSIAASDTKTILHVVHYKPEHEVIGVIQVLHGMTEHIGRYKEFAKFFYR